MHKFTDRNGKEWVLDITVSTVKRVRSLTGVDLMGMAGGDVLDQLGRDPVLLVDVLYAICKPQADEEPCAKCAGFRKYALDDKGGEVELPCDACAQTGRFTDEKFGEAMAGEAVYRATRALIDEMSDFFPDPGTRRVMKGLASQLDEAEQEHRKIIDDALSKVNIREVLRQSLGMLGDSSTEPQESAA
jgi:hypothetical protein